ncbi:hypothetical protein [Weissella paramesenteroides]|uniref:Putative phage head-tail adaptor n=1 Tax=Weissella paramesenteroides ATCC 33313 TaxID=585506 RepID=C5R875_WEIPA|nr:hypothetical protein [Weissella paramesenteroides]EER75659.1 putative phage head-tail adaptor [Weissella paramesenteroides ATCC 33313]
MARLQKYVELPRFNQKITFGHYQSHEDQDGIVRQEFVKDFFLWTSPYRILYHEQVGNEGPNQQEDQVYAIKDQGKVHINMLAHIDDIEYVVVRVSPWGDLRDPRGYDLLTLQRGNGVNRTYRNAGGT